MVSFLRTALACVAFAINVESAAPSDILDQLMIGLPEGVQASRLPQLVEHMRPMYAALPKRADGRLSQPVVRYALHRLMVQEHGWYIKGIEPNGTARNDSSASALKRWVPPHLQAVLERIENGDGLGLVELAALAAAIESLVHSEAIQQLKAIYGGQGLDPNATVDAGTRDNLIQLYMMGYLQAGNFSWGIGPKAQTHLRNFQIRYPGWSELAEWLVRVAAERGILDDEDEEVAFEKVSRVAELFGAQFGVFNDGECQELKSMMLTMEDERKNGRVSLASFYGVGLHSHWNFTEKVDYLRVLGALDESIPGRTSVIIPNYLTGRPNCLDASSVYAVCCRNECEDLLGALEAEIKNPMATPEQVVVVVRKLSTSTAPKDRELGDGLLKRLQQVADKHGGQVPLHSRLFAQWMHHAFPRECPFPHEAGTTSPQTADEWMAATGHDTTKATEEEMVCHVNGPCTYETEGGYASELPWIDAEELLVDAYLASNPGAEQADIASIVPMVVDSIPQPRSARLLSFSWMLRSGGLSVGATGVAWICKATMSKSPVDKQFARVVSEWSSALVLLLVPLTIIAIDMMVDISSRNDVLLCVAVLVLGLGVLTNLRGRAAEAEALIEKSYV